MSISVKDRIPFILTTESTKSSQSKSNKSTQSTASSQSTSSESTIPTLKNKEKTFLNFKICSFNIRNTTDNYYVRKDLLEEAFLLMNADILCLQEVSFLENNQLKDIVNLDDYIAFYSSNQMNIKEIVDIVDPEFNIDGNVMLFHKRIFMISEIPHSLNNNNSLTSPFFLSKTHHMAPCRNAHLVSLSLEEYGFPDINLNIINIHLQKQEINETVMDKEELPGLMKWIDKFTKDDDITFLVGDFNNTPFSEIYNTIIDNKFNSCYYMVHNKEPENTFHGKMQSHFKDHNDPETYDYIL